MDFGGPFVQPDDGLFALGGHLLRAPRMQSPRPRLSQAHGSGGEQDALHCWDGLAYKPTTGHASTHTGLPHTPSTVPPVIASAPHTNLLVTVHTSYTGPYLLHIPTCQLMKPMARHTKCTPWHTTHTLVCAHVGGICIRPPTQRAGRAGKKRGGGMCARFDVNDCLCDKPEAMLRSSVWFY